MNKVDLSALVFRQAQEEDVEAIRTLLADDALGQTREDLSEAGLERYLRAFLEIDRDERNVLMVAELNGTVVGTYQVTYIPYLSRGGNERVLIEAVRVRSDLRGNGIGRHMMLHAIRVARERGCLLAQLTTDKSRPQAHRFYQSLGFEATHEGMKCAL